MNHQQDAKWHILCQVNNVTAPSFSFVDQDYLFYASKTHWVRIHVPTLQICNLEKCPNFFGSSNRVLCIMPYLWSFTNYLIAINLQNNSKVEQKQETPWCVFEYNRMVHIIDAQGVLIRATIVNEQIVLQVMDAPQKLDKYAMCKRNVGKVLKHVQCGRKVYIPSEGVLHTFLELDMETFECISVTTKLKKILYCPSPYYLYHGKTFIGMANTKALFQYSRRSNTLTSVDTKESFPTYETWDHCAHLIGNLHVELITLELFAKFQFIYFPLALHDDIPRMHQLKCYTDCSFGF